MRILLVDGHPLFRGGMKFLLGSLDAEVGLDEAGDCAAARALAGAGHYDLVLLDPELPGMDGMDALVALRAAFPATPVVVLSKDDDPAAVRAAIDAGAMGFIPKSSPAEIMVDALRRVLAGGVYLPATDAAARRGLSLV
ncbi:MAG: response regulator [Burkholderiales bacterium]